MQDEGFGECGSSCRGSFIVFEGATGTATPVRNTEDPHVD
jgi:hypothetical protein